VFELIAVALSVAVVTHDLGQAERAEHGAHPLHASADRLRDLARVQVFIICQQFDHCECNRITEQTAQTRLSIAILFHAPSLSHFRNSGNVENDFRPPGEKEGARTYLTDLRTRFRSAFRTGKKALGLDDAGRQSSRIRRVTWRE
jgi:hypothetical protein